MFVHIKGSPPRLFSYVKPAWLLRYYYFHFAVKENRFFRQFLDMSLHDRGILLPRIPQFSPCRRQV